MIGQLKSDKIIIGKAAHFEKQLDSLIEEQVSLKEQEMNLMKKVQQARKNPGGQENKAAKTLQPAFSGASLAKRSGSAANLSATEARGASGMTFTQENQLKILKEQLFNTNRQIQNLRHQIEDMRNSQQNAGNSSYLLEAKRKIEMSIIEARQQLVTVESDYHVKRDIFVRSKDYQ